jgi:hypothetical protein
MHILATYPADGQGLNAAADAGVACDTPTPDCAVPTDVSIELRFDRFLLPGGGLAGGLLLFSGDPKANAVSLSPHYDLIERVVVFTTDAPLQPNAVYTAQVVPSTDPSIGFWAFDRAPLEAGDVPLSFSFMTGSGPAAPVTPPLATTDDCQSLTKDIEFSNGVALPVGPLNVCATGSCHAAPNVAAAGYPPMGLSLTAWGLFYTAINHVAHEAQTGNSALNPGLLASPRFGVQMNLVAPGFPEDSYLMYKLLLKPSNYALADQEQCQTAFHSPVADGGCTPPSDDELVNLREWFVRGDPMPKEVDSDTPSALSRDDLERVANWISAGAICGPPFVAQ